LYKDWMQEDRVGLVSKWDSYSTARLVRLCNQFNECQLFRDLALDPGRGCRTLSDVGCATGCFYRFFHKVWPTLEYRGFDPLEAAIEYARRRYPDGDFRVFDGNLKATPGLESDIVFCRDVVPHQVNPYEFVSDLYDSAGRYLILRLRTREVGTTNLDVSQSCKYTYGHWVPYIVFNTSELIDLLRSFKPTPAKITLRRHPVVLGGQHGRFLPKELYYPETGTAETALLVEKGTGNWSENTDVTIETCPETRDQDMILWVRALRRLARRWVL